MYLGYSVVVKSYQSQSGLPASKAKKSKGKWQLVSSCDFRRPWILLFDVESKVNIPEIRNEKCAKIKESKVTSFDRKYKGF